MHYYTVKSPLTLFPGTKVCLTQAQVSIRQNLIKKEKGDKYQVLCPVQFKKGETLGFACLPSKSLLASLVASEDKEKEGQCAK